MFYVFSGVDKTLNNSNFSKQFRKTWCDAWEIDRINGEAERCPICGRYVSALEWLAPRKIRLTNSRYPDRLSEWLIEPLVVSERFVNAYEVSCLSGIREFIQIDQVKPACKTIHNPPNYYCAKIDYTQKVRVNYKESKIYGQKYDWSCELCNPTGSTKDCVERLVLDTKAWDGEDIFRVYGFGIVASTRFYKFVTANDFTNFELIPVEEYRWGSWPN